MLKYLYTFCLTILVLTSCSNRDKNLEPSVGKLGSLVIVATKDVHAAMNSNLDSVFLKEVLHLPGGEPFFELLKPDPDEFLKFFSNQKSVLVLVTQKSKKQMSDILEGFSDREIDDYIKDPNPVIKDKQDVYAKYQHILYLFGKNEDDLKRKLLLSEDRLNNALLDFEIKDQHDKLFKDPNENDHYFKEIKDELKLGVKIPSQFVLKEHKDGFWWFEYNSTEGETPKTIALLAHQYTYKDTTDFSYTAIRTVRDSVLKYHVKGEIKGTYMGTSESDAYPPRFRDPIKINDMMGIKVRGWWNMEGLIMGGPFIRYVIPIPGTKQIFAFEGFVYKPNLNTKEKDLRLIESIALSIH